MVKIVLLLGWFLMFIESCWCWMICDIRVSLMFCLWWFDVVVFDDEFVMKMRLCFLGGIFGLLFDMCSVILLLVFESVCILMLSPGFVVFMVLLMRLFSIVRMLLLVFLFILVLVVSWRLMSCLVLLCFCGCCVVLCRVF